jgi:RNase P subunit RPR2
MKKTDKWGKVFLRPPFENREKLVVLSCDKCQQSFWTYPPGDNYFARVKGTEKALEMRYKCKKCGHVNVVVWEPIQ